MQILRQFRTCKIELFRGFMASGPIFQFPDSGTARAIFAVSQCDMSVPEIDKSSFDEILELFDMNEERTFASHPKFDFGPDLFPDWLVLQSRTCRIDRFLNLVSQPQYNPWLVGPGLRQVT